MTGGEAFEAVRAREERSCPQCGYRIANPLAERCPRCFAAVARVEVECGACAHQGNCEIAALKGKGERANEFREQHS